MLLKSRLALLGLWLGIASAFSFIVAPAAFKVLPSRTLAGDLVNRVLGSTEIIGMVVAIALLVLLAVAVTERTRAFWIEFAAYVLMALTMMASKFVVSPYLHELREKYGDTLSNLPLTHSGGEAFAEFHLFSETLMGVNLLVTLVLLVWLVRRKTEPQPITTTTAAQWKSQHA